MPRHDGRDPHDLRPVEIVRGFARNSPGSVLYRAGGTTVLVTAQISDKVPPFLEGKGVGWLTAEVAAIVSNHEDARRIAEHERIRFVHLPVTPETKPAQAAGPSAQSPRSGVTIRFVQPSPAVTVPSGRATVSTARTTVVPTAMTRPPHSRTAFTSLAVSRGTRKRSAYGRSRRSCEETPVWSVIGATRTPSATSRVISSGVNGRPALAISALPGSTA